MKAVYGFYIDKDTTIEVAADAEVLSVVNGKDNLAIVWVKHDPAAPKVKRRFVTFRTQKEISPDLEPLRFVGTMSQGRRPYHIFEVMR